MKSETVRFGSHELRLVQEAKGWVGIVVGRSTERYRAETRTELLHLLETAAGKAATGFVGFQGARERFLKLFPGGFRDKAFIGSTNQGEGFYKRALAQRVSTELPVDGWERLPDAPERALRLFRGINLIDPFTKTKIANVLRGPRAHLLLETISEFAIGNPDTACHRLTREFRDDDIAKWVVLTFLPFFWLPDRHIFLKPEFTKTYAERVGHRFATLYEATPNAATYNLLLEMAEETRRSVADLEPQDMIDIHSFMWVVVDYADLPGT